MIKKWLMIFLVVDLGFGTVLAEAASYPLIDAHSQFDEDVSTEQVVRLAR